MTLALSFAAVGGCSDSPSSETGESSSTTDAPTSTTEIGDGATTEGTSTGGAESTGGDESSSGGNLPPDAVGDVFYALAERTLIVPPEHSVLANDADPDGDALELSSVDTNHTLGQANFLSDASFGYTGPKQYWGPDRFEYTVVDQHGASATAEATVFISPTAVTTDELEDPDHGIVIDPENPLDGLGYQVSIAGDVNGDGIADILLGAQDYGAEPTGPAGPGRAYVVFGGTDLSSLSLDELGDRGFTLTGGETELYAAGSFVSGLGDVNGDGLDDFVVHTYRWIADTTFTQRALVVFGKADSDPVQLTTLGNRGFEVRGHAFEELLAAGDVNGDGLADILIGSPSISDGDGESDDTGRAHVVFGKADTTTVDVEAMGEGGFTIVGDSGRTGWSVTAVGDLDGDGLSDLALGAPLWGSIDDYRGRSYVVFGTAAVATIELSALGDRGFTIDGAASLDGCGRIVRGLGDVDGDGIGDLAVASGDDVYVVFGKGNSTPVALGDLGDAGFRIESGVHGQILSVSALGDLSGDGLADFAVGAPLYSGGPLGVQSGRVFVLYGRQGSDPVSLEDLEGSGFTIDSDNQGETIGFALAGGGDINGDGTNDLLLSGHPIDEGRVYALFGVPYRKEGWSK